MNARTASPWPTRPLRIGRIVFLLTGSIAVGMAGYWAGWPDSGRNLVRLLLPIFWLLLAWAAGTRRRWEALRAPCLAFFAVSLGIELAWLIGDWPLRRLGLTSASLPGMVVAKCAEAAAIVAAILVVNRCEGKRFADLLLRRGRVWASLGWGLGVSALLWLSFLGMGGGQAIAYVGTAGLLAALPLLLLFGLANGFMEELWFRGLFLGRFEAMVGSTGALFVTTIAFGALHLAASYAGEQLLPFLANTLFLGLACGLIAQSTRALWGAVLVHAAGDVLVLLGFFWALL